MLLLLVCRYVFALLGSSGSRLFFALGFVDLIVARLLLFETFEEDNAEEVGPGRLQPLINRLLLGGRHGHLDVVEGIDPFLPDLVVLCPEKHDLKVFLAVDDGEGIPHVMRQCQICYLVLFEQLLVLLLVVGFQLVFETCNVNYFVPEVYVVLDFLRGAQLLEHLEEPCRHI